MKKTLQRIEYLKDKESVDELTDLLQQMGIPMGSDEWANLAICKIHRLIEANDTLQIILNSVADAKKKDNQEFWLLTQRRYEAASVQRCRERDNYIPPNTPNTWTCANPNCKKLNMNHQNYCWNCSLDKDKIAKGD